MQELSQRSCNVNSFGHWQADYAAHGIATFPVGADKIPMIRGHGRVGLVGSAQIANKFANAPAIGFMGGKRSGITSLRSIAIQGMNESWPTP
jgi:hypothetical protein